jgi:hypothetical protein
LRAVDVDAADEEDDEQPAKNPSPSSCDDQPAPMDGLASLPINDRWAFLHGADSVTARSSWNSVLERFTDNLNGTGPAPEIMLWQLRRMDAINTYMNARNQLGMTAVKAAEFSASCVVPAVDPRTVFNWLRDLRQNDWLFFTPDGRGKYQRFHIMIDLPNLRDGMHIQSFLSLFPTPTPTPHPPFFLFFFVAAMEWIRAHHNKAATPPVTCALFMKFFNEELCKERIAKGEVRLFSISHR